MMRSLLTAGGGSARKLLAIEYGFAVSGVDFVDTRWGSLVKAVLYIANVQSKKDLARARERLKELAADGDTTAADALAEPDSASMIFNVLYQFVEAISAQDLERDACREADLSQKKMDLLKYFANPYYFEGTGERGAAAPTAMLEEGRGPYGQHF